MKALIIYKDFASAMKAKTTLQNLNLPAETRIDWEVSPWRIEMLKFPPTATEAFLAGADAHLVLFVGSLAQSLPFWLLDWLQRWAATRLVQDAVLAVTSGASGIPPALPVIYALREFASQHGLSFISGAEPVQGPWIIPPARNVSHFEAYRHWGINE